MKKFIHKNLSLMERSEKIEFFQIFILMFISSSFEVLGILSIMPFIAVLSDPDIISSNTYLHYIYERLAFDGQTQYLFFLGSLVLALIVIGNIVKAAMTWRSLDFGYMQNYRLSKRLFGYYLKKPYYYFLNANSADISSHILTEVSHYINGVLMAVLRLLSSVLTVILIIFMLLFINPVMVIGTLAVMACAYALIYMMVRRRLVNAGEKRYFHSMRRYKTINEAVHGIKQIKLHGKEDGYLQSYANAAVNYSKALTLQGIVGQVPRFFMETIAFGLVIMLVLYLLAMNNTVGELLPLIAVYVFAGYRLIPALQQIFSSATSIRFQLSSLDTHYKTLEEDKVLSKDNNLLHKDVDAFPLKTSIRLEDVSFSYNGLTDKTIDLSRLEIKAGEMIGLVGETGSGKTTLIDILLGLLPLERGQMIINDKVIISNDHIEREDLLGWQKTIGYVPQSIYLTDASLIDNIAFGVAASDINFQRVEEVAGLAQLHDFITQELPHKYETILGENGVRLSGGQKQRIGLARALYADPSVLILDEATSALDGVTEKKVLESLQSLSPQKTIIMIAHRLDTLSECDCIYVLEKGSIVGQGTYEELLNGNRIFQDMANKS